MDRITVSIKDVSTVEELTEWLNKLPTLTKKLQRDWLIKKVKLAPITVMWQERGGFKIVNKG